MDDASLVRFLLDSGADPTAEDNKGSTPASYCTNKEILSLLEQFAIKVRWGEERNLTVIMSSVSAGKAEKAEGGGGGEEEVPSGGEAACAHRGAGGPGHSCSGCHQAQGEWLGG